MTKDYHFGNFFVATVANFTRCELPERDPDYVSFSGSTYWDCGDRVKRWSNHWGPNTASCCWYLEFETLNMNHNLCGECYYEEFRSIGQLLEKIRLLEENLLQV